MLGKLIKSLLTILLLAGLSQEASAQIKRIAAGVSESGVPQYIEVYEYDYVTEKPCFPGDESGGESMFKNFVNANRVYPKEAYDRGIQGSVTCWFVVNRDGSISHVNLLRMSNDLLNREAVRILSSMPKWIPGRINGIAVPVRVIKSIRFRK